MLGRRRASGRVAAGILLSYYLRGLRCSRARDYVGAPGLDEPVRDLEPGEDEVLGLAVLRGLLDGLDPEHGAGKLLLGDLHDVVAVGGGVEELNVGVARLLERALQGAQPVL